MAACGSMEICPVCFWEDAPGEFRYNDSNQLSLAAAQQNYSEFGAAEREYVKIVRPPRPEEARPSGWLPAVGLKALASEMIHDAFDGVTLDGGISVHQADVIDGYGDEKAFTAARLRDPETRWKDIADSKIKRFNQSMTFLDPRGFLFYLPAYIIHALDHFNPVDGHLDADGVLFATSDRSGYHHDNISILNPAQKQATAVFLKLCSLYAEDFSASRADNSLENGFSDHLPEFLITDTI
jgi:hypothetical protein